MTQAKEFTPYNLPNTERTELNTTVKAIKHVVHKHQFHSWEEPRSQAVPTSSHKIIIVEFMNHHSNPVHVRFDTLKLDRSASSIMQSSISPAVFVWIFVSTATYRAFAGTYRLHIGRYADMCAKIIGGTLLMEIL